MSTLLTLLRLPWLRSLAGVSALIMMIWYVGPLLSLAGQSPLSSEHNRVLLALILIALWAIYQLGKYLVTRRKNKKLAEQLAAAESDPSKAQSEAELDKLQSGFKEALRFLGKAKLGQGRQLLYQLPWYIIIGPPGAGKTTLLLESTLNFPLKTRLGKKFQGIGGTRNCDWWFTDEAVLLDTAGRYSTQDSNQAIDSKVWLGFLDLLKKFRSRQPINGVIVAVSIPELLSQSESERQAHAHAIKQRVQELNAKLEIRFPIYMLFTKLDLLAGFVEFFADLNREDREQVWGMTFPLLDADHELTHYTDHFNALALRLYHRLPERLQQEQDPESRTLIYTFPQQFQALIEITAEFLNEVFEPDPFETPPLLRGVYFSSATQRGNPIDRMIGSVARALGMESRSLSKFSGAGKAYFVKRLLQEVIFREAHLAGTNRRRERLSLVLRWAGYLAPAVLGVLLIVLWTGSYFGNKSFITDVDVDQDKIAKAAVTINDQDRELLAVLPVLDQTRAIPSGYDERDESAPWRLRFGLYQGHALGAAAEYAYHQQLVNGLLSRFVLFVEARLRQQLKQPEALFTTLNIYLMLDDPAHFNAADVLAWAQHEFAVTPSFNASQRKRLLLHLEALLEELPQPLRPIALDLDLIDRARTVLQAQSSERQIYQQLIRPFASRSGGNLQQKLGRYATAVFARESGSPLNIDIPYRFTYPAYESFLKTSMPQIPASMAQYRWVTGVEISDSNASDTILRLYLDEYGGYWRTLLRDLDMICLDNLEQASDVLTIVSGLDSPLRKLLQEVRLQTFHIEDLQRDFAAINALVPEEPPQPLDTVLNSIRETAQSLPTNAASPENKTQTLELGKRLQSEAEHQPSPLDRWIRSLADGLSKHAYRGIRLELDKTWQTELLPLCRQIVAGRSDQAMSEWLRSPAFTRFFGTNGSLEKFVANSTFRGVVDVSQSPWTWKRFGDNPGIPPTTLIQLENAARAQQLIASKRNNRSVFAEDAALRDLLSNFHCPRCL